MKNKIMVILLILILSFTSLNHFLLENTSGLGLDPDWGDKLTNTAVCTANAGQYLSGLISDGRGGVILTWYDYRSTDADIYAQRVDLDGNTLWTVNGVVICSATDTSCRTRLPLTG